MFTVPTGCFSFIQLALSYGDVVKQSNPISYWRLAETSGTQAVDEINNNALPGVYVGNPLLNQPSSNKDVGDKSVSLNGTSQGIDFGNNPSQDINDGTVECWVKATNLNSGVRNIFMKRGYYEIYLENNILKVYSFGQDLVVSTGINLGDNLWHYLALTIVAATTNESRLYVDGILKAQITIIKNLNLDTRKINVGFQTNVNGMFQFLSGSVDEPAIYGRVLPQSEILAHYNAAL